MCYTQARVVAARPDLEEGGHLHLPREVCIPLRTGLCTDV